MCPAEEDHDPSVPADSGAGDRGLPHQLLQVAAARAGNPAPPPLMCVVFVHCAEEDNDYAVPARARPHCDRLRL